MSEQTQKYLTEENYPEFKALYTKAVDEGAETFEFEGQLILTTYAKYVVEYLGEHIKTG